MQFVFEPGRLTEEQLRDELAAALQVMRGEPEWRESVLILTGVSARDALRARGVEPTGGVLRNTLVQFVRDPALKGAVATTTGLLLRGALDRIRARRGGAV